MVQQVRPTEEFEQYRPRLKAVASRMLGSSADAEDAVQETWLRFHRADTGEVRDLNAWLTTVVARVCLNMLQARRSRPEVPLDPDLAEAEPSGAQPGGIGPDPEQEAVLADSVGLALLVVLDTLSPAQRVALVLHDMFGVSFEEIAPILGRTAVATRQLASRARRQVREPGEPGGPDGPAARVRQAEVVDAFLAAARRGDFQALLAVLDPEVVLRADPTAATLGAPALATGADPVAKLLRRARRARAVFADGRPAAAWIRAGQLQVLYRLTVRGDRITAVDLVADPAALAALDLVILDAEG
jgi:RNA polymerase sigma factor (sigma-70 family)